MTLAGMDTAGRAPLRGLGCGFAPIDAASAWADALLRGLGANESPGVVKRSPRDAAIDWAVSGAMALTGYEDGPPRLISAPLAACARGAGEALAALAGAAGLRTGELARLDAAELLGERAALLGLRRRGRISAGGSCRLLRVGNGTIAVNLARDEDWASIPAWLQEEGLHDLDASEAAWEAVAETARMREPEALVDRGRLLGIPLAVSAPPPANATPWLRVSGDGPTQPGVPARRAAPLVVDLSSLWAGPLCTRLLGMAGARVVKVESSSRPDGARRGPAAFFDQMHAGKQSFAVDFTSDSGCEILRALLERADIVVESSRPRALAQLGIDADAMLAARAGLVWLSITGYGRAEPCAHWVAFGDDAAVAAGAAHVAGGSGDAPIFCGDAIADPLAGLHGALAALAFYTAGQSALLDVSMSGVVAHALHGAGFEPPGSDEVELFEGRAGQFSVKVRSERAAVRLPAPRPQRGTAPNLGEDTTALIEELRLAPRSG